MKALGFFVVCALALASCGKNDPAPVADDGSGRKAGGGTTAKCEISNISFVTISGTSNCAGGLGGTNVTYAANTPLTREENNIQATVTFPADNAAVTLVSNAAQGLRNGVNVTLTRVSTTKFAGRLQAGAVDVDFTDKLPVVDTTKAVTFSVDVSGHSHHGGAADAIIYVGEEDVELPLRERYTGTNSGFVVNNSVVTGYQVTRMKHGHP